MDFLHASMPKTEVLNQVTESLDSATEEMNGATGEPDQGAKIMDASAKELEPTAVELGRGRGISNLDKKARITRPAPLI